MMYASLGCGALSAKCIAGPNILDYFSASLGVTLDPAETPFAKPPPFSVLIFVGLCASTARPVVSPC